MKVFTRAFLAFSVVLALPVFSQGSTDLPSTAKLIEQLGSDSFAVREKASDLLWRQGESVFFQLEEIADSEDPEVALRATKILELLELGLTPETPEKIVSLVEAYRSSGAKEKQKILYELKKLKAYRQLLVLYSKENPELKNELKNIVRGVAIVGAREAIFQNDFQAAIRLLKINVEDPMNVMALATLSVLCAERDLGFESMDLPKNVPTEVWEVALLRAKGDFLSASEIAAESGRAQLHATLKMLQGDPSLLIGLSPTDLTGNTSLAEYKRIALKRWLGAKLTETDFQLLSDHAKSSDEEDSERALMHLAMLGRLGEFEERMKKANPLGAFLYYLSQERIPAALQVMGFDPEKPDYLSWFAQRMDKMMGSEFDAMDDFDLELGNEIGQVAGFLEKRGLERELADALTPALDALASENEGRFLSFLEQFLMPSETAPEYALKLAAGWAGDDEDRWKEVYRISLKDNADVLQWHAWIGKMKPQLDPLASIQATRAMLGLSSDPQNLKNEWFGIAWETIKRLEGDEQKKFAGKLLSLAVTQGDVATSLKIYDLLGESFKWSTMDKYLSAAGRWGEAVELITDSGKYLESSSPEVHAFLAANYRRAGMLKEEAKHNEWVEKLTLGLPRSCRINAKYYSYGGDYERAAIWKKRAIATSEVDSDDFVPALKEYAKLMMDEEQWDIASSCYEGLLHFSASEKYPSGNVYDFARIRLKADLSKALSILSKDRVRAIDLLDGAHRNFLTDGILADDFLPIVRKAGLFEELDGWFAQSWEVISEVIAKYPKSENTRNTAAWLASRAGMKLSEAENYLRPALERNPNRSDYLDTMAELQFAKGNRKEAIKWSNHAVMFMPQIDQENEVVIRAQNDRFKNDPLPK